MATPSDPPLLCTYRRCPYAMRARMALLHAGITFDAFEITLRTKPTGMLAASPKGTVPVLILHSGAVIEESLEIMQWAYSASASAAMWAQSQTHDLQALITTNDGEFKQHLDRYKYPERFPEDEINFHRHAALKCLIAPLELRLRTQAHLGGAQACAADLAIFPFVRQYRAVDVAWFDAQPMPATQAWLQYWLASQLFADCMKKLPTDLRVAFSSKA